MDNIFTDSLHRARYNKLSSISRLHDCDWERMSLFYIISGNEDLYVKKKAIYDFFENSIMPECLTADKVDLCSSSKALIRLGFNLYNGYIDSYTNPLFLLCGLDSKNLFIAFQAILLRLQGRHHYSAVACHGG
ncbi:MAG: DUF6075 family protein [Desulfitobacteriaceae bacterium]|nr:DUF6075 family protein [Desulfitobacteriaceae bacterium]